MPANGERRPQLRSWHRPKAVDGAAAAVHDIKASFMTILLAAPIRAQWVALVCGHRDERVAPQRVMIVEILVTGGQAQHALGEKLAEGMLDKEGLACVEKTGGQDSSRCQK